MGAHSTINVTRSKARSTVIEHVLCAGDEELERLLDRILDAQVLNCRIVLDDDPDNQDDWIR